MTIRQLLYCFCPSDSYPSDCVIILVVVISSSTFPLINFINLVSGHHHDLYVNIISLSTSWLNFIIIISTFWCHHHSFKSASWFCQRWLNIVSMSSTLLNQLIDKNKEIINTKFEIILRIIKFNANKIIYLLWILFALKGRLHNWKM